MTLKITPTTEVIPVENINVLLYGTPGIGKTSIACSAKGNLTLDFDLGAHRSAFRSDVTRVNAWREVANLDAKDLAPYATITLDTVGRALDQLALHLIQQNPKLATSAGNLTLQGWGELKGEFIGWMRKLRLMGKDVIMVAHDKEDKRDEITVARADIQGGSYAEIFKLADSVAWFGPGGEFNRGILDFNPTPEHSGKNPGQIPLISVPNLHQEPQFMVGVIKQIKDRLGEIGERGRQIAAAVDEHREDIDKANTMKRINELASESQDIEDRAVQLQVKHLVNNRAKALGLVYDKDKKAFVKNKQAEQQDDEQPEAEAPADAA